MLRQFTVVVCAEFSISACLSALIESKSRNKYSATDIAFVHLVLVFSSTTGSGLSWLVFKKGVCLSMAVNRVSFRPFVHIMLRGSRQQIVSHGLTFVLIPVLILGSRPKEQLPSW